MIIIFLDIDGVLVQTDLHASGKPLQRLMDRYREQKLPEDQWTFDKKEMDEALVSLFDADALSSLHELIANLKKNGHSVGIVISSNWRRGKTVDQLKELFKPHDFAKDIIDKTVDELLLVFHDMNVQYRPNQRGEEIDLWLQDNSAQYDVKTFVILDDNDWGISELFPIHFVQCVDGVLTKQDALDAAQCIAINSRLKEQPLLLNSDNESEPELELEAEESAPINKLSLFIKNGNPSIDVEQKPVEKYLRVTSETRRDIFTFFAKCTTSLPDKCIGLIWDYDNTTDRDDFTPPPFLL